MKSICILILLASLISGCGYYESGNAEQVNAWNEQLDKQLDKTDEQQKRSALHLQATDKLQKQFAEQVKRQQQLITHAEALRKKLDAQVLKQQGQAAVRESLQKKQQQLTAKAEAQQKQFDALLQRWGKQADRYDKVLGEMEKNASRRAAAKTAPAPRQSPL